MWLDMAICFGVTLSSAIYLWINSKKPTHGCTREQATRVAQTQR